MTQTKKSKQKKVKQKQVIPGFGVSLGVTVTMLSLIVLIPLCSLIIYTAKLSPKDFLQAVTAPMVLASYRVSILTSLAAALVNAVMGLIIAWVLVRYDFPGKKLMDGIIELPFALPTAVAGIALTHLCVPEGWVGRFFGSLGIQVAYTRFGITIALIFIGIPFVVRSVQPVLEKVEPELEEAAGIMGASRRQTFFGVLLPEILPSLIAGFTMAFARGLGEYGSVVFIAGNTPFQTEITPLLIMTKLEGFDYPGATAIALMMLLMAFAILFINGLLQSYTDKVVRGR